MWCWTCGTAAAKKGVAAAVSAASVEAAVASAVAAASAGAVGPCALSDFPSRRNIVFQHETETSARNAKTQKRQRK